MQCLRIPLGIAQWIAHQVSGRITHSRLHEKYPYDTPLCLQHTDRSYTQGKSKIRFAGRTRGWQEKQAGRDDRAIEQQHRHRDSTELGSQDGGANYLPTTEPAWAWCGSCHDLQVGWGQWPLGFQHVSQPAAVPSGRPPSGHPPMVTLPRTFIPGHAAMARAQQISRQLFFTVYVCHCGVMCVYIQGQGQRGRREGDTQQATPI